MMFNREPSFLNKRATNCTPGFFRFHKGVGFFQKETQNDRRHGQCRSNPKQNPPWFVVFSDTKVDKGGKKTAHCPPFLIDAREEPSDFNREGFEGHGCSKSPFCTLTSKVLGAACSHQSWFPTMMIPKRARSAMNVGRLGANPLARLTTEKRITSMTKGHRRPNLSPRTPNIRAPTGRNIYKKEGQVSKQRIIMRLTVPSLL